MTDNLVEGANVYDQAKVTGNAFLGGLIGVSVPFGANFAGVVEKNLLTGNHACGVFNKKSGAAIVALNNYWGAATGPGPAPADQVGGGCDFSGTTTAAPFATKPFNVIRAAPSSQHAGGEDRRGARRGRQHGDAQHGRDACRAMTLRP